MHGSSKDWNISFAGCGFLMAYYCGVYSCLFERAPFLLYGLSKICGASSGALMGAVVACKMPPAKCCEILLEMSREARIGILGAARPSFNLLKTVRNFLNRDLPDDAHLLATGRLCVSLTRASDRSNVLISEFDSRHDLIQALVCSCFYPLYCGVIPPSHRGTRYVDGALSDNMPYSDLSNTITVSPFSGESDISPSGVPSYFHKIHYNNVSIYFNCINAYRVVIAFFPPEPKVLAEMCQNGYKDAFQFLRENDFLRLQSPLCELALTDNRAQFSSSRRCVRENKLIEDDDITRWPKVTERSNNILPESISKVFHEANKKEHEETTGSLLMRLVSLKMWCVPPVEMVYLLLLRIIDWLPEMWVELLYMWKMKSEEMSPVWKRAFWRTSK